MSNDLITIKLLSERAAHAKYGAHVPDAALTAEAAQIVADIGAYFVEFADHAAIDPPTFVTWWRNTRHPSATSTQFDYVRAILRKALALSITPDIARAAVTGWRKAALAARAAEACLQARHGGFQGDLAAELAKLAADFGTAPVAEEGATLRFCKDDIAAHQAATAPGWEWRIEELNRALGPLRPGDFVLVGGRPEYGKTSFVVSETTHMLEPDPKASVLWVNNEEGGPRLFVRYLSCILGSPGQEIIARLDDALAAAAKRGWTPERVQVMEAHGKSLAEIDAIIDALKPAIVVLHRIDKLPVPGNDDDANEVTRLARVAFWSRQLAMRGVAVIAVVQADVKAHGQMFFDDSMLYGSKTALQSETDAIICIGADTVASLRRGINIPRNKLLGGPRSDEHLRHGQFEVAFNHETGRYSSIAYR